MEPDLYVRSAINQVLPPAKWSVEHHVQRLKDGQHLGKITYCWNPKITKFEIIDGWHRFLALRQHLKKVSPTTDDHAEFQNWGKVLAENKNINPNDIMAWCVWWNSKNRQMGQLVRATTVLKALHLQNIRKDYRIPQIAEIAAVSERTVSYAISKLKEENADLKHVKA